MFLRTLILFLLTGTAAFAQVDSLPAKTQKYNGYGLPNTRFKKIKIDLSKKKVAPNTMETFSTPAPTPVTTGFFSSDSKNTNLTAQLKEKKVEPPVKLLGFILSSSYNRQGEKQKDGTLGEYYSHILNPSLQLGEFSLLGYFYYYDDIKSPGLNEWQDSVIALTKKPWELGNYFTLASGVAVTLPLSKASREIGQKYSIGTSLTLGLNTKNMGLPAWIFSYSVGYTKMNNEFETSPKGEPVTSYRIRQRINIGYNFTDAFSFKTRFQYDSAYAYSNVVRNAFLHFQVFGYQFNDHLGVYVGHTNGGNAFLVKESEQDYYLENNVKFFDPNASEYAVGIDLSI